MGGFKDKIQSNPIVVVVTAAIAAASVAAGAVTWFWQRQAEIDKASELLKLNTVQTSLETQVNDLKHRLVSIERAVSGEKLYFDVTSIPTSRARLTALPRGYQGYDGGKFYVAVPTFSEWTRSQVSQLDFAEKLMGPAGRQLLGPLQDALEEQNVTLWAREDAGVIVSTSGLLRMIGVQELHLFPYVQVMHVDSAMFRKMLSVFEKISEAETAEMNSMIEKLEALSVAAGNDVGEGISADADTSGAGTPAVEAQDVSKLIHDEKLKFLDTAASVFSGEIAGVMLFDEIGRGFNMAMFAGGTFSLISAEKKGSVLYVHSEIVFANQDVGEPKRRADVVIQQEAVLIASGGSGLFIRMSVPSYDRVSDQTRDAVAWTQAWLTSLKVPVN